MLRASGDARGSQRLGRGSLRAHGPGGRSSMPETRIAIAGLGAIGRTVARRLAGGMPGLTLVCAASGDVAKAKAWLDKAKIACPLVELAEFPRYADLAVECAPAEILESICTPMLTAGKRVMVLSAGALLPRPHLLDLARQHGGEIIVPTGALRSEEHTSELPSPDHLVCPLL